MKRIIYDVPRWNVYLHRHERNLPLVKEDDSKDLRFEDEIFERLYGEGVNQLKPHDKDHEAAEWAEKGHTMCDGLGLDVVRPYCQNHPFNSALATAWLMELIEEPLDDAKAEAEEQPGKGGGGEEELAAEGLENVDLAPMGIGEGSDRVENLSEYLKRDQRLLEIALLAGRLRSTVITKQRSRTTSGAQEITNITVGGELARLIPSELVRFVGSKRFRLAAMRDLIERKMIQYEMIAEEPLAQGPIIVCLDKSGSMKGERDVWASAVALGLLEVARRQKRAFGIVGFNHEILQIVVVKAGEKLDVRHLMIEPTLGTDIGLALATALTTIQKNGIMEKADIVLISDGEDSASADKVRHRAESMGVTIFGIGIGTTGVRKWCHQSHVIEDLTSIDGQTAELLFKR